MTKYQHGHLSPQPASLPAIGINNNEPTLLGSSDLENISFYRDHIEYISIAGREMMETHPLISVLELLGWTCWLVQWYAKVTVTLNQV